MGRILFGRERSINLELNENIEPRKDINCNGANFLWSREKYRP